MVSPEFRGHHTKLWLFLLPEDTPLNWSPNGAPKTILRRIVKKNLERATLVGEVFSVPRHPPWLKNLQALQFLHGDFHLLRLPCAPSANRPTVFLKNCARAPSGDHTPRSHAPKCHHIPAYPFAPPRPVPALISHLSGIPRHATLVGEVFSVSP